MKGDIVKALSKDGSGKEYELLSDYDYEFTDQNFACRSDCKKCNPKGCTKMLQGDFYKCKCIAVEDKAEYEALQKRMKELIAQYEVTCIEPEKHDGTWDLDPDEEEYGVVRIIFGDCDLVECKKKDR